MSELRIKNKLLKRGNEIRSKRLKVKAFTGDPEKDLLVSDLKNAPHAFVVGSLMTNNTKADRAFSIPYELQQRIGTFDFDTLYNLRESSLAKHFQKPSPLHRFPKKMSNHMFSLIQTIGDEYEGDASMIWSGKLGSADVVYRFLQFTGFGPKIATMATNILARSFKVKFKDYYSIDISVDVHVKRVFRRLGLTKEYATNTEVIYKARALHPEYPGMLDYAAWEIGRNWCRPKKTDCEACYMRTVCPTSSRY